MLIASYKKHFPPEIGLVLGGHIQLFSFQPVFLEVMVYTIRRLLHIHDPILLNYRTGPDGAVVKSSANGLVGTGFTSLYNLQPRAGL